MERVDCWRQAAEGSSSGWGWQLQLWCRLERGRGGCLAAGGEWMGRQWSVT